MTREALRRRLRVIVPLAVVAVGLALVAWLRPRLRHRQPAHPLAGDASLLVLERVNDTHRLVRVAFKHGEALPPETVWEGPTDLFGYSGRHTIVGGRHVATANGGVIDLWTGEVLRDASGELIEATDTRVVFKVNKTQGRDGIFAFDLKARKTARIAALEEGPSGLPGVRSPDGTKSLTNFGHTITLHQPGQPPRELGSDFWVEQSRLSSNHGSPPVLWLDNDRFLTQVGNGRLFMVVLDGTRTPVVDVPAKTEVVGAPHLERDLDGRIVYSCGTESFLINAEARTWERHEWPSLGQGFDASNTSDGPGRYVIRHRGEEIGRSYDAPAAFGRFAATDGLLATIDEPPTGRELRVWSSTTGKWTALDLRATVIVGWMK